MSLSSVALTGVFIAPGWEPDPMGALKAIAAAGFKRVQIPLWYPVLSAVQIGGVTFTLAELVALAHELGLGVDITLHTDGRSGVYQYLCFVNPTGFATWAAAVLAGAGLLPLDTVAWWNELSPQNSGDWGPLPALYSALGNVMNQMITSAGAAPVCPFPMSQTPRDVYNAFTGELNPQLFRARPRYAAHLYKEDLTDAWGIDKQFAWLDAASTLLDGAPIDINEFGGSVPGPGSPGAPVPDMAFYEAVVSRCAARGWRCCAWQWRGPGTGLEVHQFPALISLLVGSAVATA